MKTESHNTRCTYAAAGTYGHEWAPLWAAMKSSPDAWIDTTESMYWAMLEAVPPVDMAGGAFLVGEADHHNDQGQAVYACFRSRGGYRARYLTLAQFRTCMGVAPSILSPAP